MADWGFSLTITYHHHISPPISGVGHPQRFPLQDIEWARDGDDGKLYIVQARPETVASQKKVGVIEEYKMLEKGRDFDHDKDQPRC